MAGWQVQHLGGCNGTSVNVTDTLAESYLHACHVMHLCTSGAAAEGSADRKSSAVPGYIHHPYFHSADIQNSRSACFLSNLSFYNQLGRRIADMRDTYFSISTNVISYSTFGVLMRFLLSCNGSFCSGVVLTLTSIATPSIWFLNCAFSARDTDAANKLTNKSRPDKFVSTKFELLFKSFLRFYCVTVVMFTN